MTVPGIDGQKMSKSYDNTIDIFLPNKQLKKRIMSIQTDSKELEEPKDPDSCNVFKIFSLLADKEPIETMRNNYLAGGYGYGHAKKELLNLILSRYEHQRERYNELMENRELIDQELKKGAVKARAIAQETLQKVRSVSGY